MIHQTGRFLIPGRTSPKFALPAICLCLFLLAAGSVGGQELQRAGGAYTLPAGSIPPWAVPVLRLVSSTHVEPTTGIVISDNGLVLVPEKFASMGDEIIVLDGGTDIIRNGRPARIERKFTTEGLQVLLVDGLKRSGVTLAAEVPVEDSGVVLAAFPPAEQIAQGKPPLSIPASIVVFAETGSPVISGETELPNVTGGLVDRCGNLVGVSLADDVQSMEHSAATRYQWRKTLLYVFSELQITPRESACPGGMEEQVQEPVIEDSPAQEPAPAEPAVDEVIAPEDEPAGPAPEEPQVSEEAAEAAVETLPEEILPPIEQDSSGQESAVDDAGASRWPWLLAALALFGSGLLLHRLRRARGGETDGRQVDLSAVRTPGLEEEDETETPLASPGSLLLIRGVLSDGTPFEDSCPVSEHAINVVIGRGDADLKIDSQAVSRQHANLNGTARELTVSDQGSSNGTSINGVPCLEGEIMFIEPGDILVLGDARCTIEIKRHDASGSSKQ